MRAKTFEEALQLINDHEFGNGVAIFTRDGEAAREFTQRVQAGMVGMNIAIQVPIAFTALRVYAFTFALKQPLLVGHQVVKVAVRNL